MSLIIPANSAAASGGFSVDNSLRFNRASSDSLNRTFGTPTNSKKLTISFWTKFMAESGNDHHAFSNGDSNANESLISFINSGNHNLEIKEDISSSPTYQFVTNRVFRDSSAWFHIVIAWDSSQGTESNRLKLYINGVQETSLASANYPNLNQNIKFNTNIAQYIGKRHRNEGAFFNGYMAEVVFIDGTQYAASDFGEFDEDSGIWKPINVSGLTFGNNGFYLDFENSGALGNDAAGSNNFTVNNLTATDQSTDTCTNNFATLNPLDNYWSQSTFSEGNCVYTGNNTSEYYGVATSTIGISKGRWYFEAKVATSSGQDILGITSRTKTGYGTWLGSTTQAYGYYQDNGEIRSGGSDTSYGQTYGANDIIGIYLDLEDNKMYVSDNGSLMNSGTGHTITAAALTDSGFYHFAVGDNSDSTQVWQCNFGGTSGFAISSAVADDNGFGAFEYSPNITGDSVAKKFYSLCTKNLAEFG